MIKYILVSVSFLFVFCLLCCRINTPVLVKNYFEVLKIYGDIGENVFYHFVVPGKSYLFRIYFTDKVVMGSRQHAGTYACN